MSSKFKGDFVVQKYICDKIFTKIRSLFPEIYANYGCKAHLAMLKNPSKILDPILRCRTSEI